MRRARAKFSRFRGNIAPNLSDKPPMRFPTVMLAGFALAAALVCRAAPATTTSTPGAPPQKDPPIEPVWEARLERYDDATYERQVEALISAFEQASGRKLVPGPKKKVGLKIYADSGPGLADEAYQRITAAMLSGTIAPGARLVMDALALPWERLPAPTLVAVAPARPRTRRRARSDR